MVSPSTAGAAAKLLFTAAELAAAKKLYKECKPGEFNRRVVEQIVQPALPRIDKDTGQENDARYFGYWLEYLITEGCI